VNNIINLSYNQANIYHFLLQDKINRFFFFYLKSIDELEIFRRWRRFYRQLSY